LGVAADIISKDDLSMSMYPIVKREMGMSESEMWECIHMNDGLEGMEPHTFPEIADKIEAMLDEKPLV
jgi:hypothetical protein